MWCWIDGGRPGFFEIRAQPRLFVGANEREIPFDLAQPLGEGFRLIGIIELHAQDRLPVLHVESAKQRALPDLAVPGDIVPGGRFKVRLSFRRREQVAEWLVSQGVLADLEVDQLASENHPLHQLAFRHGQSRLGDDFLQFGGIHPGELFFELLPGVGQSAFGALQHQDFPDEGITVLLGRARSRLLQLLLLQVFRSGQQLEGVVDLGLQSDEERKDVGAQVVDCLVGE